MRSLSIFGTSSDAGKSTIALVITYLLAKKGIKVTPFKAQNVSNNSNVTDDFGEIAVPQFFTAEAIKIPTTYRQNPILLKSSGEKKAHLIINGKSVGDRSVWGYYKDLDTLKPIVKEAFLSLKNEYDTVVAEGAGSPVELNLMEKDLSNIYIAKEFDTKIILVADIEKGGVFASIWGVYNLLPKELRKNVIGVIINKFRGDIELFKEGVKIIEDRFSIKVLGVVPYKSLNLAFEDSASLTNYSQELSNAKIKVGVIKLPHISNFNDFEPLVLDKEIDLRFIESFDDSSDLIILPGSKRVTDDIAWLKRRGLWKRLKSEKKIPIVAICGGYEMMFEEILDDEGVESSSKKISGLGRFEGNVIFQKEKILKKGIYDVDSLSLYGYEIHNGVTKELWQRKGNIFGTFLHGIFDNDNFRKKLFGNIEVTYEGYNFKRYKDDKIEEFCSFVGSYLDMDRILKEIDV